MVLASQFEYNNQMSDDWNLILCKFDDDGIDETSNGLDLSPITDELVNKDIDYGAKNDSKLSFDITLVHKTDSTKMFTRGEIRELSRWLLTPDIHWLKLYDEEYDDYWALGRFLSISKTTMEGKIPAVTVTFESVYSYYYSDVIRRSFTVDGSSSVEIIANGDELEGYMYPDMTIKNLSGDTVTIQNSLDSMPFSLSGLEKGETITIDGQNLILYSDKATSSLGFKIFGDMFNRHWLKFFRGTNTLKMTGSFQVTFEYREARRIGEF